MDDSGLIVSLLVIAYESEMLNGQFEFLLHWHKFELADIWLTWILYGHSL